MIGDLFSTEGFVDRAHCGTAWTPELILLAQLANIAIVISYYLIPLQMYYLYRKRKHQIFKHTIFKIFILFPIVCGISRICNILVFYWAPYRFYILCDFACAIAAGILCWKLHSALDYLISLPSVEQIRLTNILLAAEISEKQKVQEELQNTNQSLNSVIIKLNHLIQKEMWIYDKKKALEELDLMLKALENGNK